MASAKQATGEAAVEGISVGQERYILQRIRREHQASIADPRLSFIPYVSRVQVGRRVMTQADFIVTFKRGQRRKARHDKNRLGAHLAKP